ncbi:MAG: DUF5110 domain-containing protein, partial [Bacteroidota bacterium]
YYEDDGISFKYREGAFFKRTIRHSRSSYETQVQFGQAEGTFIPRERRLVLRIVGAGFSPTRVTTLEKVIPAVSQADFDTTAAGWIRDGESGVIHIKTDDSPSYLEISLKR